MYAPYFLVVSGEAYNEIKHLVFFSEHLQTFFYPASGVSCVGHDLLWNTVWEFVGVSHKGTALRITSRLTPLDRFSQPSAQSSMSGRPAAFFPQQNAGYNSASR